MRSLIRSEGYAPHAQPGPPSGSSDIEQAWVARTRTGDVQAFEAIFRTYYDRLCAFATRCGHSADQAQDLVQEVFVRGWEQRADCRGCDNLRGYLYTAVRYRSLKVLRHQRVARRTADAAIREQRAPGSGARPGTPEENAGLSELAAAARRAIDGLPDRSREAFLLCRDHGMTYAEAAEVMGISLRTVENHLARAVKGLRAELAAWIV